MGHRLQDRAPARGRGPDRRGDRRRQLGRVVHLDQVDPPHVLARIGGHALRQGDGQARLAGAADAGQREQANPREHRTGLLQLTVAADEAAQRARKTPRLVGAGRLAGGGSAVGTRALRCPAGGALGRIEGRPRPDRLGQRHGLRRGGEVEPIRERRDALVVGGQGPHGIAQPPQQPDAIAMRGLAHRVDGNVPLGGLKRGVQRPGGRVRRRELPVDLGHPTPRGLARLLQPGLVQPLAQGTGIEVGRLAQDAEGLGGAPLLGEQLGTATQRLETGDIQPERGLASPADLSTARRDPRMVGRYAAREVGLADVGQVGAQGVLHPAEVGAGAGQLGVGPQGLGRSIAPGRHVTMQEQVDPQPQRLRSPREGEVLAIPRHADGPEQTDVQRRGRRDEVGAHVPWSIARGPRPHPSRPNTACGFPGRSLPHAAPSRSFRPIAPRPRSGSRMTR